MSVRLRGVGVALGVLMVAVLSVAQSAQSQVADPSLPPAIRYDGLVVYDASGDAFARYYFVEFGARRSVDPATLPQAEIVGISPEDLEAIPEASPLQREAPSLPPTSRPYTPTAQATPTATLSGTPLTAPVTTAVAWDTPGPIITVTPGVEERPLVQSLGAGRRSGADVVFAATTAGQLYRYDDTARSYQNLSSRLGLAGGDAGGALMVSRDDPPLVVYTTTRRSGSALISSVHRSADGGETWQNSDVPGAQARVLYQLPTRPEVIYMGTNDGVLVSTDRGATWAPLGGGLPTTGFVAWAVAQDPNDAGAIFVGGANLQGTSQVGGRLFGSGDGGTTWREFLLVSQTASFPTILALAFDPTVTGRLLMGVDGEGGVFELAPPPTPTPVVVQPGETPVPSPTSQTTRSVVPRGAAQMSRVAALAFRPGAQTIPGPVGFVNTTGVAGTPVAIATVTAGQGGGYAIPAITPGTYQLTISGPSRKPDLFAGTLSGTLSGATGSSTGAGSAIGGVYLSTDGGFSWSDATNGIATRAIGQVAFSADGQVIFVGGGAQQLEATTTQGGVYRGTTQ